MKLNDLTLESDYLQLDEAFYERRNPTPLKNPHLISANKAGFELIGLDFDDATSEAFVRFMNGELLKAEPYAMGYAGHQFGHLVAELGDGRAINLGAIADWHLQLKGSGLTRFSRQGDGRAVLRSSIREYLMSEMMHALGIPTTRALAIIGSEERVFRDEIESGAIVLRMAKSWVRFGTFEYFFYNDQHDHLRTLADYVIKSSFSHLLHVNDPYYCMFTEIADRYAKLMAQWQSVGFNHGVMNTDNMAIDGVTIDYGPFAFLDDFAYKYVCNHSDYEGRYSFNNQPSIAMWNLKALAHALSQLVDFERSNGYLQEHFAKQYIAHMIDIMMQKMGLHVRSENDEELVIDLIGTLDEVGVDYTLFFRTLSSYEGEHESITSICIDPTLMHDWLKSYDERLVKEQISQEERHVQMKSVNPKIVLKNYIIQEAIEKAKAGDFTLVDELLQIAQNPFDEHTVYERYAKATPNQFKNSRLSCSS